MKEFKQIMSLVIKPEGKSPVFNCMLAIKDEKKGLHFSSASGTSGESGNLVSVADRFRTGSITKLFTATIILQLIEEELLRLDDSYFELINEDTIKILTGLHTLDNTDYSKKITIQHLLQHSSGIPDYFSDDVRFLNYIMQHPLQLWNWKLIMEKYFEFELHLKPSFVPGNGFHYSDTNFLLLGILIEQIIKKPLHQVYREKIIMPLGLHDTYLEFYELPEQIKTIVYPYFGTTSLENINTSFDWGGGGLISTMNDLEIFIRNLIKGILFKKKESLNHLMRFQNTDAVTDKTSRSIQYGLGIQKKYFPGYSFFGHNGAYGSMLFYEPDKDISIILSLNQSTSVHKAEWLMKKIILGFQNESSL